MSYSQTIADYFEIYGPNPEHPAEYDPPMPQKSDTDAAWVSFSVLYHPERRPIQVHRVTDPTEVALHIQETLEKVRASSSDAIGEISDRLLSTQQIIVIECALEVPDQIWEDLDAAAVRLCNRLDGVVVAPEGIYDEKLRPLVLW